MLRTDVPTMIEKVLGRGRLSNEFTDGLAISKTPDTQDRGALTLSRQDARWITFEESVHASPRAVCEQTRSFCPVSLTGDQQRIEKKIVNEKATGLRKLRVTTFSQRKSNEEANTGGKGRKEAKRQYAILINSCIKRAIQLIELIRHTK